MRVGVGVLVGVNVGVAVGSARGEPLQANDANISISAAVVKTAICDCFGNMRVFPFSPAGVDYKTILHLLPKFITASVRSGR